MLPTHLHLPPVLSTLSLRPLCDPTLPEQAGCVVEHKRNPRVPPRPGQPGQRNHHDPMTGLTLRVVWGGLDVKRAEKELGQAGAGEAIDDPLG